MSQVFGRGAVTAMMAAAMIGAGSSFPPMTGQRVGRPSGGAKRPTPRSGDKLGRMAWECRLGMPTGNTYVGPTITWPQSRAKAKKARAL